MQTNVLLPQLELTMESVQVAGWLVKAGDRVEAGQALLEVETQKSVVEVPSPAAGYVRKLCVAKGDTIGGEALLCILTADAGEPFSDAAAAVPPSGTKEAAASSAPPSGTAEGGGIRAAPAARKLAAERGLDLAAIPGTGPGGRISLDDVKRAAGI